MIVRQHLRHPSTPERRESRHDHVGNETELRIGAGNLAPLDILPNTTASAFLAHPDGRLSASMDDRMIGRHRLRHPTEPERRGNRYGDGRDNSERRLGAGRPSAIDIVLMATSVAFIVHVVDRVIPGNAQGGRLTAHHSSPPPCDGIGNQVPDPAAPIPVNAGITTANSYMERKPE